MRTTKLQRLRQIEDWLRDHFETPYPVSVRYMREVKYELNGKAEQIHAITSKVGKKLVIHLSMRWPLYSAIETFIHEWAHCIDWRTERHEEGREEHPDGWGLEYGKIYRSFFDEGGIDDSGLYPPRDA